MVVCLAPLCPYDIELVNMTLSHMNIALTMCVKADPASPLL